MKRNIIIIGLVIISASLFFHVLEKNAEIERLQLKIEDLEVAGESSLSQDGTLLKDEETKDTQQSSQDNQWTREQITDASNVRRLNKPPTNINDDAESSTGAIIEDTPPQFDQREEPLELTDDVIAEPRLVRDLAEFNNNQLNKDSFDRQAVDPEWAPEMENKFIAFLSDHEELSAIPYQNIECKESICAMEFFASNAEAEQYEILLGSFSTLHDWGNSRAAGLIGSRDGNDRHVIYFGFQRPNNKRP